MENFDEYYKDRVGRANDRADRLVVALTKAGRQEELFRGSESAEYRELLYKEFHIDG